MKHNKEYLDAKYVIENPMGYEKQMVYDAQNFVRGYEAALSIADVSNSFTADEVVNELEQQETLDDAIIFFKQNWIE